MIKSPGLALALAASLLALGAPRSLHRDHGDDGEEQPVLPAWLAGCWQARTTTDTLEEFWTLPRGATMLGLSRLVHDDSLVTFEQNRIAVRGARMVFISRVADEQPTEYTASALDSNQVLFDASSNKPRRILYRRRGDTLHVRFATLDNGTMRGVEAPLRLVACEHQRSTK